MDKLASYCLLGEDEKYQRGVVYLYGSGFMECLKLFHITDEEGVHYIAKTITQALQVSYQTYKHSTFDMCVDVSNFSLRHLRRSFIILMSQFLQQAFPEKMNYCYVHHTPPLFASVYDLIDKLNLIDRRTKSKIYIYRDDIQTEDGLNLLSSKQELEKSIQKKKTVGDSSVI